MKKILFTIFTATCSLWGYSQMQFGVQAGVAISNVNRSVPGLSLPGFSIGSNHIVGPTAGATASLKIWKWLEFRPELNFIQRGSNISSSFVSYTVEGKYTLNYLDIPLNVVYQHQLGPGKIFGGLGPEIAFGLSGKGKGDNNQNVKIKFDGKDEISSDFLHLKTTDLGLSFCLGYQLHNGLFLNGGYYLGLTDIDPNKDFDWKNHGFSIKVGYMFSR